MKKILLFITIIIALVSCEKYCPYCDNRGNCDYCGKHRSTLTYTTDYFCAETLLGTWQMDYNPNYNRGMGIELKEIKFFDSRKCDITYSEGNDPTWYTETYNYTYASGFIRFDKGRSSFTFKYKGFIFPELYLQDSFGNYTWRKVRSNGC
jgi:hypothetical protein